MTVTYIFIVTVFSITGNEEAVVAAVAAAAAPTAATGAVAAANDDGINDDDDENAAAVAPATLSPLPKTLEQLWIEYKFGVGGRKPASLFTAAERGKVKHVYSFRLNAWDAIAKLVNSGMTSNDACQKIYETYGHGLTVTNICRALCSDKKRGGHPNLVV